MQANIILVVKNGHLWVKSILIRSPNSNQILSFNFFFFVILGNFNATDVRSLQGFKLQNNGFVKYVKIELLSFHGSEHYCPISLIRIFGTSLFDEVERIENSDSKSIEMEADQSDQSSSLFEESLQKISDLDLFNTTKNAIINVVSKAFNGLSEIILN